MSVIADPHSHSSQLTVAEVPPEGRAALLEILDCFRESTAMKLEDERQNRTPTYYLEDSLGINSDLRYVIQNPEDKKIYCCKDSKGTVLGIMVLSIGDLLRLEYLYTNPDNLPGSEHAVRGVGFRLIEEAVAIALREKISQITLQALPNALPTYQKFGFQVDERDFGYSTILCWLDITV